MKNGMRVLAENHTQVCVESGDFFIMYDPSTQTIVRWIVREHHPHWVDALVSKWDFVPCEIEIESLDELDAEQVEPDRVRELAMVRNYLEEKLARSKAGGK